MTYNICFTADSFSLFLNQVLAVFPSLLKSSCLGFLIAGMYHHAQFCTYLILAMFVETNIKPDLNYQDTVTHIPPIVYHLLILFCVFLPLSLPPFFPFFV